MKKALLLCAFQSVSVFAIAKHNLINVKKVNPHICVELPYATVNNFTHERIYECANCYVHADIAGLIDGIQKELESMVTKDHPKGLSLKIWDAYRPLSAQKKMWDASAKQFPDEKERSRYVDNPVNGGGRHTRAVTFDVTLVDNATKKELDMGTGFDEFSKRSWRDYKDLAQEVKANRALLEKIMAKYGFIGIKSEWWHFDYKDWKKFEPLDIALSQLD